MPAGLRRTAEQGAPAPRPAQAFSRCEAACPGSDCGCVFGDVPHRRFPGATTALSIDRCDMDQVEAERSSATGPPLRRSAHCGPRASQPGSLDSWEAGVEESYVPFQKPARNGSSATETAGGSAPALLQEMSWVCSSSSSLNLPQRIRSALSSGAEVVTAPNSVPLSTIEQDVERLTSRRADEAPSSLDIRHLMRVLERYHRYVERVLKPRMVQEAEERRVLQAECARLRADNGILARRLNRYPSAAAGKVASSPIVSAAARETSGPHPTPARAPLVHPEAAAVIAGSAEELVEARERVANVERQLRHPHRQPHRPGSEGADSFLLEPLQPQHVATEASGGRSIGGPTASQNGAVDALLVAVVPELAALCGAIAEDGAGFSEAHARALELISCGRRHHEAHATASADVQTKPFGAVVALWQQLAQQASAKTGTAAPPPAAAACASVSAHPLFPIADLLRSLSSTLQAEHRAVAASLQALRMRLVDAEVAAEEHRRRLVNVQRDMETRVAELETDHEVELRTLEETIGELEQQMCRKAAGQHPRVAATEGALTDERAPPAPPVPLTEATTRPRGDSGAALDETTGRSGGISAKQGRLDGGAQTELSLEWIHATMRKLREEPSRPARREREAELVELMLAEVERLRVQLTDSRAVAARLQEQQRCFLGDVTVPLCSFTEGLLTPFSAFA